VVPAAGAGLADAPGITDAQIVIGGTGPLTGVESAYEPVLSGVYKVEDGQYDPAACSSTGGGSAGKLARVTSAKTDAKGAFRSPAPSARRSCSLAGEGVGGRTGDSVHAAASPRSGRVRRRDTVAMGGLECGGESKAVVRIGTCSSPPSRELRSG
jgi:hypothetical protein